MLIAAQVILYIVLGVIFAKYVIKCRSGSVFAIMAAWPIILGFIVTVFCVAGIVALSGDEDSKEFLEIMWNGID